MYGEIFRFAKEILHERPIWKGGELWTSTLGGVAAYFWFDFDSSVIGRIRSHFPDLLSASSIVFGFSLTSYFFCIDFLSGFAPDSPGRKMADQAIRWQSWTALCLHLLIGYTLVLWSLGIYLENNSAIAKVAYATLLFLALYCGLEILNHILSVKWLFENRSRIENLRTSSSIRTDTATADGVSAEAPPKKH